MAEKGFVHILPVCTQIFFIFYFFYLDSFSMPHMNQEVTMQRQFCFWVSGILLLLFLTVAVVFCVAINGLKLGTHAEMSWLLRAALCAHPAGLHPMQRSAPTAATAKASEADHQCHLPQMHRWKQVIASLPTPAQQSALACGRTTLKGN